MSTYRNTTLRKRTDNLESVAEDYAEAYSFGNDLAETGRLIKHMAMHMRDLQTKIDSQAEHIKALNEKLERREP